VFNSRAGMNALWPDLLPEITRGLVTVAGWWILFYKLHRPPAKARRIAMLISLPALYVFWMWIPLNKWMPQGSGTANAVLWALIILFFALLAGDWRNSFFTALFYIGVEQTIDVTRHCAVGWFFGGFFKGGSAAYYIQSNAQYLFVLGWTVFYYLMMRGRSRVLSPRFWIMTVFPPFAAFWLLTYFSGTADPLLPEGINIYFNGLMFGLFFFISHHFAFYTHIRLITFSGLRMEAQTLQSQLEAQSRQNRLIEGAQKQTAEIRHEIKNLLFALQTELEQKNYEGMRTRLNNLLGDLKQYEQKPWTGVPLIDAMISWKAEKLREYGAVLSVTAEPLEVSGAFAHDITSLLAIALDNAIDAAESGAAEQEKETGAAGSEAAESHSAVRCLIRRQKNLLFIRITNPLTRSLKRRDGELLSAKDEAGHGLGIPALRRIVERYSGEIRISGRDGVFSLEVMLMEGAAGA
jgi:hypothetical protein